MDMNCKQTDQGTCLVHGSFWPCTTQLVLQDVAVEREHQFRVYGSNRDIEDGTGPDVKWLPAGSERAAIIEKIFREGYERHELEHKKPTWMHLVREEIAEAFMESDPERLTIELTQVAALCVSWLEKIRERRQWGVLTESGSVIVDESWHCPADVMRGSHYFGLTQVTVVWRWPEGSWQEWGT